MDYFIVPPAAHGKYTFYTCNYCGGEMHTGDVIFADAQDEFHLCAVCANPTAGWGFGTGSNIGFGTGIGPNTGFVTGTGCNTGFGTGTDNSVSKPSNSGFGSCAKPVKSATGFGTGTGTGTGCNTGFGTGTDNVSKSSNSGFGSCAKPVKSATGFGSGGVQPGSSGYESSSRVGFGLRN